MSVRETVCGPASQGVVYHTTGLGRAGVLEYQALITNNKMVSLVRRPAWGDESSLNFSTTYLSVLGDGPSYQLRSDGRNTSVGPIILQIIQIKLIIIIHCSTFLENVNFLLVAAKLSINSYSIAVKVSK